MMCWSPLAGGMLTGKYDPVAGPQETSRVGLRKEIDFPRYWNESSFRLIAKVVDTAREIGRTPSQLALAWLLHDQRVATVILGCRTPDQLQEGLIAGDWDIEQETRDQLSQHVPFARGYPDEWIAGTWKNIAGQEEFAPFRIPLDFGKP